MFIRMKRPQSLYQTAILLSWFSIILLISGFGSGCAQQDQTVYQPAVAKLIESANTLKNSNQTQAAICRLEAAADIAPKTYQVQYNLGVLYSESSQWEAAVSHLQKALEISPHQPNGLYTLGYTYEAMGDQYFWRVDNADPKALEGPDVPAMIKGLSQEEAKQKGIEAYQKAVETYQLFLEKAPEADPARKEIADQIQYLTAKIASV